MSNRNTNEYTMARMEDKQVLLCFPDRPARQGFIEAWSPLDGHIQAQTDYIDNQTQAAPPALAKKVLSRYLQSYGG